MDFISLGQWEAGVSHAGWGLRYRWDGQWNVFFAKRTWGVGLFLKILVVRVACLPRFQSTGRVHGPKRLTPTLTGFRRVLAGIAKADFRRAIL